MAGLLNLDSLGTGIRSLLDNPAFGGGQQGQQGNPAALPFGDFAGQSAATSLWGGGQSGLGQPATSLWGGQQGFGQASTSLWGGDLAGTTGPLAPVYGQSGTGYDQLGRVFSSGVGLQNTLDQQAADKAARAAAQAKEAGQPSSTAPSSTGLGTPGGDFGSPSADVLNAELNGTALAGQGQTILDASARHGIPASALMAIFKQESSYRTPSGANNYGGLRPADGSGGFASYPDLATGIDAVAGNLGSALYRGKSLADVIGIWAPSSENDTATYLTNALATVHRLGGSATGGSIVSGQSQAPAAPPTSGGGGGSIGTIFGGTTPQVMQPFGRTPYSVQHPDTYNYGSSFGLAGDEHPGIDYAMPLGSQLYNPLDGTVVYAGGSGYYTDTMSGVDPAHSGEYMVQLSNGDQVIVGHMSRIDVQPGQHITAGTPIGLSGGSDGAHAHVEVRQRQPDGSYRIVNPESYFAGR